MDGGMKIIVLVLTIPAMITFSAYAGIVAASKLFGAFKVRINHGDTNIVIKNNEPS